MKAFINCLARMKGGSVATVDNLMPVVYYFEQFKTVLGTSYGKLMCISVRSARNVKVKVNRGIKNAWSSCRE